MSLETLSNPHWAKRFMEQDWDHCDICGKWSLVKYVHDGRLARCAECEK